MNGPRVLKLYKEQGCSGEQGETSLKSPHRSATGKELNGMLVRKRKGRSAYASNFEDTERLSLFEMAWACDNIYCWRWFLFWFNFSHFSVYPLHNTADFFKIVLSLKFLGGFLSFVLLFLLVI